MQQKFRGDLIPETTHVSHGREGKMKQQFRFLLAGFSLIALLVSHAVPVEAQETTFFASVISLTISVSPAAINIGPQVANTTVTGAPGSPQNPTITVTNNSTVAIKLIAACTNARDTSSNTTDATWICEKDKNGQDMFMLGVNTSSATSPYIQLEGPMGTLPGAKNFPNPGMIATITTTPIPPIADVPNNTATVFWQFTLPTQSTVTTNQEFQLLLSGAVPN